MTTRQVIEYGGALISGVLFLVGGGIWLYSIGDFWNAEAYLFAVGGFDGLVICGLFIWEDSQRTAAAAIDGGPAVVPVLNNQEEEPNPDYVVRTYNVNGSKLDEVTGTVKVDTMSWQTKCEMPRFVLPPKVSLNRSEGGVSEIPGVSNVTETSFIIRITKTELSGEWIWKATGVLAEQVN